MPPKFTMTAEERKDAIAVLKDMGESSNDSEIRAYVLGRRAVERRALVTTESAKKKKADEEAAAAEKKKKEDEEKKVADAAEKKKADDEAAAAEKKKKEDEEKKASDAAEKKKADEDAAAADKKKKEEEEKKAKEDVKAAAVELKRLRDHDGDDEKVTNASIFIEQKNEIMSSVFGPRWMANLASGVVEDGIFGQTLTHVSKTIAQAPLPGYEGIAGRMKSVGERDPKRFQDMMAKIAALPVAGGLLNVTGADLDLLCEVVGISYMGSSGETRFPLRFVLNVLHRREKLKTWSCKDLMESKSPSDVTTWMDNGQRGLNLGTKSELWKFGDTVSVAQGWVDGNTMHHDGSQVSYHFGGGGFGGGGFGGGGFGGGGFGGGGFGGGGSHVGGNTVYPADSASNVGGYQAQGHRGRGGQRGGRGDGGGRGRGGGVQGPGPFGMLRAAKARTPPYRPVWDPAYSECWRCGGVGHMSAGCTRPVKCFGCALVGHCATACPTNTLT